jgi:hypothetical protein
LVTFVSTLKKEDGFPPRQVGVDSSRERQKNNPLNPPFLRGNFGIEIDHANIQESLLGKQNDV